MKYDSGERGYIEDRRGGGAMRVGGLGLGLSIVKELAERHGGSAMAESAGPNMGATFTVRLPARQANPGSEKSDVRSERPRLSAF